MKFIPHDYQRYAIEWILQHPIGALLLDMGLGKTVITLSALCELLYSSFEVERILIIAPLRVARDTWPNEILKWDHLKELRKVTGIAVGDATTRKRICNDQRYRITIINRDNVAWLVENIPWTYDMVVIDELSSFKSSSSRRFRALMKVRPKVNRILGLTGTPTSNGLLDLFAQFKLLDMGQRLGRFITNYRQEYFLPDKRSRQQIFTWKPKSTAEEAIYSKISDITVSMRSVDYLDMPKLVETTYDVILSDEAYHYYRCLLHDFVLTIEDKTIDAMNAAVLTGKLMQLANGAFYDSFNDFYVFHNAKLDALEDIIESANGHNVLVAYWFKYDRQRLLTRFSEARALETSQDMADWNAGKIPIGLIHPASAGHGLNLQSGGSILIWYTLTWSLELYQQTNARLYRQGQTDKQVTIIHMITKNTIEQDVYDALKGKNTTQQVLIDAVKANISLGVERYDGMSQNPLLTSSINPKNHIRI